MTHNFPAESWFIYGNNFIKYCDLLDSNELRLLKGDLRI